MIIAVDFDGTLCEANYPYAGRPNEYLLNALRELKRTDSAEIILWTCRVGEALKYAVNWCEEHGLELDAVNENLPRIVEQFGGDNRKIFANVYIDDSSVDFSLNAIDDILPEPIRNEFIPKKDKYLEYYIIDELKEKCYVRGE